MKFHDFSMGINEHSMKVSKLTLGAPRFDLFNGYRHMPPTLLERGKKEDACMYVVVKTEYVLKEGGCFNKRCLEGRQKGGKWK